MLCAVHTRVVPALLGSPAPCLTHTACETSQHLPHCALALRRTRHLLGVLFLHRFEVGSEIHGDFVLGAQQRAEDGVSRHADASKVGPLELPSEVQHLDVQVFNLGQGQGGEEDLASLH